MYFKIVSNIVKYIKKVHFRGLITTSCSIKKKLNNITFFVILTQEL